MAELNLIFVNSDGDFQEHDPSADSVTFSNLKTNKTTGFADDDVVPYGTMTQLINGLDWQDNVLDKDLAAPPGSPTTGDRYIVASSGTGDWSGQDGNIAEWDGSAWQFTTAVEGLAVVVEDEDRAYWYDGSSWSGFAGLLNHDSLNGISGSGTYHVTSAENTWLTTVSGDVSAANILDKTADESITGVYDYSSGQIILPSSANGSPSEGDVYWDGSADKLYVYNGASYQEISAEWGKVEYTAGAGGLTAGDPVYISGVDTVTEGDAGGTAGQVDVVGVALSTVAVGNPVTVVTEGQVAEGVLSGATAGTRYWLGVGGGLTTTRPTGSGEYQMLVGRAKNATDLTVNIRFIKKNA